MAADLDDDRVRAALAGLSASRQRALVAAMRALARAAKAAGGGG